RLLLAQLHRPLRRPAFLPEETQVRQVEVPAIHAVPIHLLETEVDRVPDRPDRYPCPPQLVLVPLERPSRRRLRRRVPGLRSIRRDIPHQILDRDRQLAPDQVRNQVQPPLQLRDLRQTSL